MASCSRNVDNDCPSPDEMTLKSMKIFHANYGNIGSPIGYGKFSTVHRVKDKDKKIFAAKNIVVSSSINVINSQRELSTLSKLNHPNIVTIYGGFQDKQSVVLLMEFLSGGMLYNRIIRQAKNEKDAKDYVRQLLQALLYLHTEKSIVHLDIKPENIVCVSPYCKRIKLTDFGLARVVKDGFVSRFEFGTKSYMSPEIINHELITVASDMWSLGVTTYFLLSGRKPFKGTNNTLEYLIKNRFYSYNYSDFKGISSVAKNFIDRLLLKSIRRRMTVLDALSHAWVDSN